MKSILFCIALVFFAQQSKAGSLSLEADALAYALNGYSAIVRKTFDNGFEIALGGGRFELPKFILEMEQKNFDAQKWEADCTGIQVLRVGYRWSKTYEDGFSTHLIAMKQDWTIKSKTQNAETRYTAMSTGLSVGYTYHIGAHFYVYPTAAFTFNNITKGKAEVGGVEYDFPSSGVNGSIHAGFEF